MKSSKNNIFVISGDFHQGKTSFAKQCIAKLQQNYIVGGFLSISNYENDEISYYSLVNISNSKEMRLCQTAKELNWLNYRKFYFNPKALDSGNKIIEDSIRTRMDVLCIDEIGPLELQGKVWGKSLNVLLQSNITQIWVIRRHLLHELFTYLNIEPKLIYDVEFNNNPDFFIQNIENSIKKYNLELVNKDK